MAAVVRWIPDLVVEIFQISGLNLQTYLVFCAAFLLTWSLLKRSTNLPPYPAGRVPVLGHLLALGRAPHVQLTEWRRQYGDVFTIRMGLEDVVILNGYTAVKDALVDRSELFASRPPNCLFDAVTDCGKDLASVPWGITIRQRRRFATTALKNLGMKIGSGSIEEKIREEANFLRNRVAEYGGKPFDIAYDLNVAVANVICSMMFGKRFDYDDETFRELSDAVVTIAVKLKAGQIITFFPFLRFIPGVNRAYIDLFKHNSTTQRVMEEAMSRHRENLDRENPRDFLDLGLLELEKQEKVAGLTEDVVMHMAQNLFLAGTETTSNTLRWSLLYMILNPTIQNKVQEEIDDVVGDVLPTLSQRSQLPYVTATLQEVMRVRPIVPVALPHATTQHVRVRDYDIPDKTQVLVNLYSLHMDPAYWPDPDRFDPERFLDAGGNVINKPESFLPFSAGRRVCPGEQLANMELFLFFSTLLQSFTFKIPDGAPPPRSDGMLGLTLTPHPFKICAIPR